MVKLMIGNVLRDRIKNECICKKLEVVLDSN